MIAEEGDFSDENLQALSNETTNAARPSPNNTNHQGKANFKARAIGNASNQLVRNILGRLGTEQFSEEDWEQTKNYFQNRCVYCGEQKASMEMDHAIAINRESLGEHRLGNLVPSCKGCNSEKAGQHFETYLKSKDNESKIQPIKDYMESKNYAPLGDNEQVNEQVRAILEIAYDEVAIVADRYIAILNQLPK